MQKIGIIFITLVLVSCGISQKNADMLKGTWKISAIIGDSTTISADSVSQFLIFEPCEDAYTATCKVNYVFQDASLSTKDTARLSITIKEDEVSFINSSIPSFAGMTNFNKIFKQQRFFIREINEQQLHLERFIDSLSVHAVKQ